MSEAFEKPKRKVGPLCSRCARRRAAVGQTVCSACQREQLREEADRGVG